MANRAIFKHLQRKISLTAAISILLTLVAIVPLLITIISSQMLSRSQLVSQSATAMAQDAHTHVQLINEYLSARIQDVQTISSLFSLQQYLQGDDTFREQALNDLSVGLRNDTNYDSWSILNLQGNALLWYPTQPQVHGNSLISPNMLATIQQSTNPVFSGVFYNPSVGTASIVIYAPILSSTSNVIGILRVEFDLGYIWNIVNSQVDYANDYAFILDAYGVRVAYTDTGGTLARSSYLFTAIAPLTPANQRVVTSEDLYGNHEKPITIFADSALSAMQNDPHPPSSFELTPAGQQEKFEAVEVHIASLQWTYFALRPLKAIVSIADQQLLNTVLIAAIVLILAIIIGVATGRRLTQPILHSVEREHHAYVQQQYLNQMKDQILLNVSHELRTPLTEVYGYLELLTTYNDQIDESTKMTFLKRATDGCEELQLLIDDVLDTVHSDRQPRIPHLENVHIIQIVENVLELFDPRTIENYDLQIVIPKTLIVRADRQYLRQIFRNLLSNAFKYSPSQTLLVVDTVQGMTEHVETASSPLVCIRVKDSGPGISADDMSLLFKKFGRLERDISSAIRGVGLGLYISKQLVEAMGGQIWVESAGIAGQGSQFCFTLPLVVDLPPDKELDIAKKTQVLQ